MHLIQVANTLLVFNVVSFGFYMLFIISIAVFFDLSLSLDIRVLDIDLTLISLNLLFQLNTAASIVASFHSFRRLMTLFMPSTMLLVIQE